MRQLSYAVRNALCETGQIAADPVNVPVNISKFEFGEIRVSLSRAEFRERALFADCLAELLGPIQNPRYLVARTRKMALYRQDWYAVPATFGRNKSAAEIFHSHWQRQVGTADLVFTRTPEGRRAILRARANSLVTQTAEKQSRRDVWS